MGHCRKVLVLKLAIVLAPRARWVVVTLGTVRVALGLLGLTRVFGVALVLLRMAWVFRIALVLLRMAWVFRIALVLRRLTWVATRKVLR